MWRIYHIDKDVLHIYKKRITAEIRNPSKGSSLHGLNTVMQNQKAKKYCLSLGCGTLVTNGYCDKHSSLGKSIYDSNWTKCRKFYLQAHPLCSDCAKEGKAVLAEDVHHIKKARLYPELKYMESNLMGLCKHHHNIRTAQGE